MNDSHPKIALVQSRLPYIDRRALSEAWFSALHLASAGPPAPDTCARPVATFERTFPAAARATAGPRAVATCASQTPSRVTRATSPQSASEAVPARSRAAGRRSALPPPAPAQRTAAPFCTSLTIALDAGRVQLLLRRDGGTLHVIALCRPGVAETVRRALALADAQLRLAGEPLRSSVRTCDQREVVA